MNNQVLGPSPFFQHMQQSSGNGGGEEKRKTRQSNFPRKRFRLKMHGPMQIKELRIGRHTM